MIRSDNPLDDPNDDDLPIIPAETVARWHEIHDAGQPHNEEMCPWCGDDEELAEAASAPSGVPLDKWSVWPVMDSVEYMDRARPRYRRADGKVVEGWNVVGEWTPEDGEETPDAEGAEEGK